MSASAATSDRVPVLTLPDGWRVREASGPGPFVTRAVLERPDGTCVEWTSRRHRKGLGLRGLGPGRHRRWHAASRSSIAIGVLFMVGATCFAVGSLPGYADAVADATLAWTFVVGAVFFTSAAALTYHEAVVAPASPDGGVEIPRGFRRLAAWSPHRIDWWSSAIQLVGTIFFNITTYAATRVDVSVVQARRWVWAPDVLGSICFLVASWLALVEAAAGERGWRHRSVGWWIAVVNLAGSIAFGFSALAARYLRSTGEIANVGVATLGTLVGAVCFFVGAALLPVESALDVEEPVEV